MAYGLGHTSTRDLWDTAIYKCAACVLPAARLLKRATARKECRSRLLRRTCPLMSVSFDLPSLHPTPLHLIPPQLETPKLTPTPSQRSVSSGKSDGIRSQRVHCGGGTYSPCAAIVLGNATSENDHHVRWLPHPQALRAEGSVDAG